MEVQTTVLRIFISVQLSMIDLFLNLNIDLLVIGRTASNHSWMNPVERIMSVINCSKSFMEESCRKNNECDQLETSMCWRNA